MKSNKSKKNVLVAYIPAKSDLLIALRNRWYRIPYNRKVVPDMVKDRTIKLIAFYQPAIFKEDAFAIRWYGIVKDIKILKRKVLLRNEPKNAKSEQNYYKIEIEKLLRLPKPIYSRKHRRVLFITTTIDHFENAVELNDLFLESPIEEKLWKSFLNHGIRAERQYLETAGKKRYILDFALFCKKSKIDIECDGDSFHMGEDAIRYDKHRDNNLESKGWSVLRYTTDDIVYKLDESVLQVKETINRYGGLEDNENNKFEFFTEKKDESLFG